MSSGFIYRPKKKVLTEEERLAASAYTAPDNTTIASIWTRVQQLLKLGDFLGLK